MRPFPGKKREDERPLDIMQIEAAVEAMLFAYGDALPLDRICGVLELDRKTVRSIIGNMTVKYESAGRGITIREMGNSYQMCTSKATEDSLRKLFEPRQKQGLSQAAFEILAIVAYNQPVTRARIESIRGVSSESAITRLVERNLIREAGRLDAPGKPALFETTEEFLRSFGFRSVRDLPVLSIGMPEEEKTEY